MPTRRTGLVALALIAASAGISAFGSTGEPRPNAVSVTGLPLEAPLPTKVPPGTTLTIGDPTTQAVLQHNGWDKDLPFEIKWAEISGGPSITEAFHAKVLDAGQAMNIPPIHAVWVGIPVRMVAVRLKSDWQEHPTFQLAIAPKAGVERLSDLRGKKIAYSPGQAQGELVLKILKSQGLTTKDLIDPITNTAVPEATLLDFPESVVGLMKGDLGFPHRGFPESLTALVLKGNTANKYTTRAGLLLPPVDFEKNIATLSAKFGVVCSHVSFLCRFFG